MENWIIAPHGTQNIPGFRIARITAEQRPMCISLIPSVIHWLAPSRQNQRKIVATPAVQERLAFSYPYRACAMNVPYASSHYAPMQAFSIPWSGASVRA